MQRLLIALLQGGGQQPRDRSTDGCTFGLSGFAVREVRTPIAAGGRMTTHSGAVLGWAAQGGGALTHFAGIQGTFRCVEGRGIVRAVGDRWTVGLGDLVGLFQPC